MGIENVREYLKQWGMDHQIIEFDVSSATVALAANALKTDPARIAKTLSFMVGSRAILIVTSGNVKVDNRKFKEEFQCKARMLSSFEVQDMIGHEVGGVCPFGVKDSVDVYLDVSLKDYEYFFPACGNASSAIKMDCETLERTSRSRKWVDVCKVS